MNNIWSIIAAGCFLCLLIPEEEAVVLFDCNLDKETMCGMTQSANDTFDWTIKKGATSSDNTGPTADASGGGRYIYIEVSNPSSRQLRHVGDFAIIVSPSGLFRLPGPYTLTFSYHMYGSHIGTLQILALSARSLKTASIVWQKTGQDVRGSVWVRETLDLPDNTRYVAFNASKGGRSDYDIRGDIAVDEIKISSVSSAIEPTQPSISPSSITQKPATTASAATASSTRSLEPVIFQCSFDEGDFCGMTQSSVDQFDWTILNVTSPSTGTGPSRDHSGQGWYIYIEVSNPASGEKRHVGDQAVIITPIGKFSEPGPYTMTFYYHMYGSHIGNLQVLALTENSLQTASIEWQKTGQDSRGNTWIKTTLDLPDNTRYVAFKASKGGKGDYDIRGDIAIDEIKIVSASATKKTTPSITQAPTTQAQPTSATKRPTQQSTTQSTTTQQPLTQPATVASTTGRLESDTSVLFQCNFDGTTICGMTQSPDDKLDWTIRNGTTPSSGTGPSEDMSGRGWYIYIEVSKPNSGANRHAGDNAIISTPAGTFVGSGPYTLRFAYHMYGSDIGTLQVLALTGRSLQTASVVWERTGQDVRGNTWVRTTLNLPGNTRYVAFNASKGGRSDYDIRGDIAIDGIEIISATADDGSTTRSSGTSSSTAHQTQTTPSSAVSMSTTQSTERKCGGFFKNSEGEILSPNYPERYPTLVDCDYTITVAEGSTIRLTFDTFDLEADRLCDFDYLEVRNGASKSSVPVGRFCGNAIPQPILSTGNSLWLKFHSDRSMNGRGFRLRYTSSKDSRGNTGCPVVVISGLSRNKVTTAGEYSKTNAICNGRNVYERSEKDAYLYFMFVLNIGAWVVGPFQCSNGVSIAVTDRAIFPEDIAATWTESLGTNQFVSNENIDVECYTGCPVVVLRGSTVQTSVEGEYSRLNMTCNDRPVYMHSRKARFLYSTVVSQTILWVVGSEQCGDKAGLVAIDKAMHPENMLTVWKESYGGGIWKLNINLKVTCYTGCPLIVISGTSNQKSREGEYALADWMCNGRQVYVQHSSQNYLYFTGISWMIGEDECSVTGGISADEDTVYPEDVTVIWREAQTVWTNNPEINVECKTAAFQCGVLNPFSDAFVVGGKRARPGEIPWQVSLLKSNTHVCGGSIIDERWILTAAHCLQFRDSLYKVRVGEHVRNATDAHEVTMDIQTIIRHSAYFGDMKINDIALIKTIKPIRFNEYVSPVCLPGSKRKFVNSEAQLSGWGVTASGPRETFKKASNVLLKASMEVVDNSRCAQVYGLNTNHKVICVSDGIGDRTRSSCNGDSGGPLVVQENNINIVIGVASFGPITGCATGFPVVYTDTSQYIDWINDKRRKY